ncbi:crosslink repair DNA glycosylase YcaQ family protein [Pontiellaceae bacterium B12219]|nr:crosslink repair DNA glycosylase YcaQ family protein [Pontiellaceae bacterium B12219]
MIESLSISQARKLVLQSQQLPPAKPTGSALDATLSAIEHLGYVQIDTISAVQRAHHHTLWSRNPRYELSHLDQLVEDRRVFEYWSHAAAYLPMRDYRFSLPKKRALATGEQQHWFKPDPSLMKSVLKRIAEEGPLMAKDFTHPGKKVGAWGVKPAKQALETLFMQGDLMISRRVNFHKVYDLTERVLPIGIDTTVPSPEEQARFLIFQYLEANGLGQASEMTYLLKNIKLLVSATLQEMIASGEVLAVRVGKVSYYMLPATLERLNKPMSRRKLTILSPFDNLLIQRKRIKALFDFDYQLECYVPEAKRQYGYFSLPILWNGKLVARMDCKADRKKAVLHILHLALEPGLPQTEPFTRALLNELAAFLRFNDCTKLNLHKSTPAAFKSVFTALIKQSGFTFDIHAGNRRMT